MWEISEVKDIFIETGMEYRAGVLGERLPLGSQKNVFKERQEKRKEELSRMLLGEGFQYSRMLDKFFLNREANSEQDFGHQYAQKLIDVLNERIVEYKEEFQQSQRQKQIDEEMERERIRQYDLEQELLEKNGGVINRGRLISELTPIKKLVQVDDQNRKEIYQKNKKVRQPVQKLMTQQIQVRGRSGQIVKPKVLQEGGVIERQEVQQDDQQIQLIIQDDQQQQQEEQKGEEKQLEDLLVQDKKIAIKKRIERIQQAQQKYYIKSAQVIKDMEGLAKKQEKKDKSVQIIKKPQQIDFQEMMRKEKEKQQEREQDPIIDILFNEGKNLEIMRQQNMQILPPQPDKFEQLYQQGLLQKKQRLRETPLQKFQRERPLELKAMEERDIIEKQQKEELNLQSKEGRQLLKLKQLKEEILNAGKDDQQKQQIQQKPPAIKKKLIKRNNQDEDEERKISDRKNDKKILKGVTQIGSSTRANIDGVFLKQNVEQFQDEKYIYMDRNKDQDLNNFEGIEISYQKVIADRFDKVLYNNDFTEINNKFQIIYSEIKNINNFNNQFISQTEQLIQQYLRFIFCVYYKLLFFANDQIVEVLQKQFQEFDQVQNQLQIEIEQDQNIYLQTANTCEQILENNEIVKRLVQLVYGVEEVEENDVPDFRVLIRRIKEWAEQNWQNILDNDFNIISDTGYLSSIMILIQLNKVRNYSFIQIDQDLQEKQRRYNLLVAPSKIKTLQLILFQIFISAMSQQNVYPNIKNIITDIFFVIRRQQQWHELNDQEYDIKPWWRTTKYHELNFMLIHLQKNPIQETLFYGQLQDEYNISHTVGNFYQGASTNRFIFGNNTVVSEIYENLNQTQINLPKYSDVNDEQEYNRLFNIQIAQSAARQRTLNFDQINLNTLAQIIINYYERKDSEWIQNNLEDGEFNPQRGQVLKRDSKFQYDFEFVMEFFNEGRWRQEGGSIYLKVPITPAIDRDIYYNGERRFNIQTQNIIQQILQSTQQMIQAPNNQTIKDDYLNSDSFEFQIHHKSYLFTDPNYAKVDGANQQQIDQARQQIKDKRQKMSLMRLQLKSFKKMKFIHPNRLVMARDLDNAIINQKDLGQPQIILPYIYPSLNETKPFYGRYFKLVNKEYKKFDFENNQNCYQKVLLFNNIEQQVQNNVEFMRVIQEQRIQNVFSYQNHVFITDKPQQNPKICTYKQNNEISVYKKNFKLQKNQKIIYYDIETTTGKNKQMIPIIVCYQIVEIENKKYQTKQVQKIFLTEQNQNVVKIFIQQIMEYGDKIQDETIYVQAWNGSRFDNIFILQEILQLSNTKLQILGNINSPKEIYWRNFVIQDGMLNTGGGKLQQFCVQMKGEQKIINQQIENIMFKINTTQDFIELEQDQKQLYVEYCAQDVVCMQDSIRKFNDNMKHAIKNLSKNDKYCEQLQNETLLTIKTLPTQSFNIIFKLGLKDKPPQTINIKFDKLYQAVSTSYRGGVTQVFTNMEFKLGHNQIKQIQYVDVNSEYPFVMSKFKYYDYGYEISKDFEQDKITANCLYKISSFNLDEQMILGYFPVKTIKGDILYPKKYSEEEDQAEVYVWGNEIIQYLNIIEYLQQNIEIDQTQTEKKFLPEHKKHVQIKSYFTFKQYEGEMFKTINFLYNERCKIKKTSPILADIYKKIMNSSYGQCGMRSFDKNLLIPDNLYEKLQQQVNDEEPNIIELALKKMCIEEKINLNDYEIKDVTKEFNSRQVLLTQKYNMTKPTPENQKCRMKHIASQITSNARTYLYINMYKLLKNQYYPIYCDTDSIIYVSQKQEEQQIIPIGEELGNFKYEYIDIQEVQCFVPKLYYIKAGIDQQGKSIYKAKGVQLLQTINDEQVQREYDEKYIDDFYQQLKQQLQLNIAQRKPVIFNRQLQFKRRLEGILQQIDQKSIDITYKREIVDQEVYQIYNLKPFENIDQFYI